MTPAWRAEKACAVVEHLVWAIESAKHISDQAVREAVVVGLHPALWNAMKVASDVCDDPGLFSPARHELMMKDASASWDWLDDADASRGRKFDLAERVSGWINENRKDAP